MDKKQYSEIEKYMLTCMHDPAHDREHIYRVLYTALDIAKYEKNVDYDVLITACLLHDIGRKEQFENPKLCHAEVGSKKAYDFLLCHGWSEERAAHVRDCIYTHRFRSENPPITIEAKILFDSDKIDVTGAIGIARSLVYRGKVNEPLYTLNSDGTVNDGSNTSEPSFFREYQYKLKNIYGRFFTRRGEEIGLQRRKAADDFYGEMLSEVCRSCNSGTERLGEILSK